MAPSIPPCPSHEWPVWPPPPNCDQYMLQGPQVEPTASYWTEDRFGCPVVPICTVTIGNILDGGWTLLPYPTNPGTIDDELQELRDLASLRDNPEAVVNTDPKRERRAISTFLQLRPPPLGAVHNRERGRALCNCNGCRCECTGPYTDQLDRCVLGAGEDGVPVIRTGRELARYFEAETPGIAHRQALNFLLRDSNLSPPRQALIWMALDVAIYSAIAAAWYFKWRAPAGISFRPRPIECDPRLSVLFDRAVDCDGDADGTIRLCPHPSPGTPRHPAYPSGHSTYSAAGSEILSYFFRDFTAEFDNLANNIGLARLWAGIHWRTDHTNGQLLGQRVAQLIIEQIRAGCITAPRTCCDPPADPCETPPTPDALDDCARQCCRPDLEQPSPRPGKKGERGGKEEGQGHGHEHEHEHEHEHGHGHGQREREETGRQHDLPASATREQANSPQQGAPATISNEDERAQARSPQQGTPVTRSEEAERERARSPQQGAG